MVWIVISKFGDEKPVQIAVNMKCVESVCRSVQHVVVDIFAYLTIF